MTSFIANARAFIVILLISAPLQATAQMPPAADPAEAPMQDVRNVAALDVSIDVFDPGVPADRSSHRDLEVFPRIREIEAMFLPFVLRDTLLRTNEWGTVRVVPEADSAAELLVSGTIVRSDGEVLELQVRVVDARGNVWFDNSFLGAVTDNYAKRDSESGLAGYQMLYDEIANDMQVAREQLSTNVLTNIVEISLLRYANELAPSAFGEYLDQTANGMFTIDRLPARNDPMLARINKIRRTEYVITDTVDAKFKDLHAEIASVYDLWRKYRRKSIEYRAEDARSAQATKSNAERGSYEAIENLYENYMWDRLTVQEQDRLAVAFNNEVGPKVAAMEARIVKLEGWIDEKYAEWRRLLQELFEVETRLQE